MLDIFKLGGHKEKSKNGLRLVFPDVLFQFAFIYEDEVIIINRGIMIAYLFAPHS